MAASENYLNHRIPKLIDAFPHHAYTYKLWKILKERMLCHKFTEEEVNRAINNAVDNINSEHLTIAEIIQPVLKEREEKRRK